MVMHRKVPTKVKFQYLGERLLTAEEEKTHALGNKSRINGHAAQYLSRTIIKMVLTSRCYKSTLEGVRVARRPRLPFCLLDQDASPSRHSHHPDFCRVLCIRQWTLHQPSCQKRMEKPLL